MRKITQKSVAAFLAGRNFRSGNMTVSRGGFDGFTVSMYLHGNLIAERNTQTVRLHDAGWQTTTTKDRLNGLLDTLGLGRIYQKDFAWYVGDGEAWNGSREFSLINA